MTGLYWRLRWAWWGFRDAMFVRVIARALQRDAVVFVHPHGRSAAVAYIARIDTEDPLAAEPHGHIEGRMR